MSRSIPLWAVLFLGLLALLFSALVAWAAKAETEGNERFGVFGDAVYAVADFPRQTRVVLRQLRASASGADRELAQGVRRDIPLPADARPVETVEGIALEGVLIREGLLESARPGWRMIMGGFVFDGELRNAALLLSPDHRVVHAWDLIEEQVDDRVPRATNRKFPHGVEILPSDGSIIYTFDGSIGLHRRSACGEPIWTFAGEPSHAVTLTEDASRVWVVTANWRIGEVDVETGELLREITMPELTEANPEIDPLELRRIHGDGQAKAGQPITINFRDEPGRWLEDPFHLNDVDPLPPSLAEAFPQFEAGDVLLSLRELNLVLVADPDTLEIKWWRAGAVQRQHDPDWMPDGRISVYNNRMSEDYSTIAWIDPQTYEAGVLHDGSIHDFYSRIRGKVQRRHDDGSLVITASQQGRGFEVAEDGTLTYEIISTRPGEKEANFVVSELRWYPPETFTEEQFQCPN